MNEQLDSTVQDPYTELSLGSMGTAVRNLQKRLIELGYLTGTADGYYVSVSEDAVKAFEAAYGKQRTGIATVSMQNYLFADSALRAGQSAQATARPTAVPADDGEQDTVTYKALQYGSKGERVKQLQQRLKELG